MDDFNSVMVELAESMSQLNAAVESLVNISNQVFGEVYYGYACGAGAAQTITYGKGEK